MNSQVFFDGRIYNLDTMSEEEIENLITQIDNAEEEVNRQIDEILFEEIN